MTLELCYRIYIKPGAKWWQTFCQSHNVNTYSDADAVLDRVYQARLINNWLMSIEFSSQESQLLFQLTYGGISD
jgi:hypothetical protein